MTLAEASRCFPVSMEELLLYQKNGMLKGRENESGEMDYPEEELRYVSHFTFLQKAGLDMDSLKQLAQLSEKKMDPAKEQIRILRKLRFGLLDEIHGKQQELDRLDYFIHEIGTQGTRRRKGMRKMQYPYRLFLTLGQYAISG